MRELAEQTSNRLAGNAREPADASVPFMVYSFISFIAITCVGICFKQDARLYMHMVYNYPFRPLALI